MKGSDSSKSPGPARTIAGVILGAITPAKSAGGKTTFAEAVSEILPDVRDSMDREDSERHDVMLGRRGFHGEPLRHRIGLFRHAAD